MSEPYWVPLSASDTPLNYVGPWSAPATYKPGDVVLRNGVYWLAAKASTGSDPGNAVWPGGVGTSLPASPGDLQEFTLVDSMALPTYAWRFKYMAAITDAYKWVFVGGSPLEAPFVLSVAGETTTGTTAFVDLSTVGPSLTVPRAGIYQFDWGALMYNNTSAGQSFMALSGGGLTPSQNESAMIVSGGANIPQAHVAISRRYTVTAATIKAQYAVGNASHFAGFARRWLTVIPVRVA